MTSYIIAAVIIAFAGVWVYLLYKQASNGMNPDTLPLPVDPIKPIDPVKPVDPVVEYLTDEFEVSYVFMGTDTEFGAVKGYSYKRALTVTSKAVYSGIPVKVGDIVKYRYVGNQINDVDLV
jgi:hypothetical protein